MLPNFLGVFYYIASTKFYIYKENCFKINSIDTMFYFGISYFIALICGKINHIKSSNQEQQLSLYRRL